MVDMPCRMPQFPDAVSSAGRDILIEKELHDAIRSVVSRSFIIAEA
jgi:hypothetical protein